MKIPLPRELFLSLAPKSHPDDADWYHGNTMPMDGDTRYVRADIVDAELAEAHAEIANAAVGCRAALTVSPNEQFSGMTLRDYFAAQAMAALVPYTSTRRFTRNDAADGAYMQADEMMKARAAIREGDAK